MTHSNGKTQEISRRRKNGQRADESARLVEHGRNSPVDGDDQIGLVASHSSGQNFTRTTSEQGETPAGKILERLEFIENAYISYVDSHQERLQARLAESKEQKDIFKKVVQELKQEIYDLVSEDQVD